MIYSMTAFAREQQVTDIGEVSCELKSVNHRYLDIHCRLSESLRPQEMMIRDLLKKQLHRGKVEVNISLATGNAEQSLQLDFELANNLSQLNQQLIAKLQLKDGLTTAVLLKWPGILQSQVVDDDKIATQVVKVVQSALAKLQQTRQREGNSLQQVLESRLQAIAEQVVLVERMIPGIQQHYRDKLQQRFSDAKLELDDERLEQEMLLLAQKMDVVEELDRLRTHIKEMQHCLKTMHPVGRRLDFLMQEFNREANTLGSKSVNAKMTQAAVEMKVLIEQMREQVQNIE